MRWVSSRASGTLWVESDELMLARITVGTMRKEDAPPHVSEGFGQPKRDYFKTRCYECGETGSFLSKRFAHRRGEAT